MVNLLVVSNLCRNLGIVAMDLADRFSDIGQAPRQTFIALIEKHSIPSEEESKTPISLVRLHAGSAYCTLRFALVGGPVGVSFFYRPGCTAC